MPPGVSPAVLHVGSDPRWTLALLAAGPLVGVVQGLLAAGVTLPLARRFDGWLFQSSGADGVATARHLLAGAGCGALAATLTGLAVVVLPADLLGALALVRPSLPWTAAGAVGAVLLGAVVAAAYGPGSDSLSSAGWRLVAAYLLALVAVVGLTAEAAFLVAP